MGNTVCSNEVAVATGIVHDTLDQFIHLSVHPPCPGLLQVLPRCKGSGIPCAISASSRHEGWRVNDLGRLDIRLVSRLEAVPYPALFVKYAYEFIDTARGSFVLENSVNWIRDPAVAKQCCIPRLLYITHRILLCFNVVMNDYRPCVLVHHLLYVVNCVFSFISYLICMMYAIWCMMCDVRWMLCDV